MTQFLTNVIVMQMSRVNREKGYWSTQSPVNY